jgi:peptidoglycan/LPS O-acetylase OafA/YrhL
MALVPTNNLPYLDGWRGLAILLLLIGHFLPVPGINLGAVGVNLFFVLSGLLMARLLFIDAVPIPRFYQRRVSRIFPAVFFFLFATVVFFLATGSTVNWSEVFWAATFLNNYFPGEPGGAVMPFGHIWSLCVEEHSYVILSILAVAARRNGWRATYSVGLASAACAAAGITYWLTYPGAHLAFDRWLRTEVMAYGVFCSAFLLLLLRHRAVTPLPMLVVPSLLAAGMALHWWSVPAPIQTIVGTGAFALAINLLGRAPVALHAMLSFRPLRQLGLWSFSIYLWQQPFYLLTHRAGLSPVLGLGLALLAGMASFYLLERPMRAYLNARWSPAQASSTVPVKA